jgi:hypothetical protein
MIAVMPIPMAKSMGRGKYSLKTKVNAKPAMGIPKILDQGSRKMEMGFMVSKNIHSELTTHRFSG